VPYTVSWRQVFRGVWLSASGEALVFLFHYTTENAMTPVQTYRRHALFVALLIGVLVPRNSVAQPVNVELTRFGGRFFT
jgi:hypothetical protein